MWSHLNNSIAKPSLAMEVSSAWADTIRVSPEPPLSFQTNSYAIQPSICLLHTVLISKSKPPHSASMPPYGCIPRVALETDEKKCLYFSFFWLHSSACTATWEFEILCGETGRFLFLAIKIGTMWTPLLTITTRIRIQIKPVFPSIQALFVVVNSTKQCTREHANHVISHFVPRTTERILLQGPSHGPYYSHDKVAAAGPGSTRAGAIAVSLGHAEPRIPTCARTRSLARAERKCNPLHGGSISANKLSHPVKLPCALFAAGIAPSRNNIQFIYF